MARIKERRAWSLNDMPAQEGKVALVTGANTGIGFAIAAALAAQGAQVVLGCRDEERGDVAATRIAATTPNALVSTLTLDLACLSSVRRAADDFHRRFGRLDLLINNAGVMALIGQRAETPDSFEQHIGVNHLGSFALTGLLLDMLLATPMSRVVAMSSIAHRSGEVRLDDLHWQKRRYRHAHAYAASKLANLMATFELQHRLTAASASTIAVAAHPGAARTELTMARQSSWALRAVAHPRLRTVTGWLLQDSGEGALPALRAATDEHVVGGDYYGPAGVAELTGPPVRVTASPRAHNSDLQRQLWERSEELTGVHFTVSSTGAPGQETSDTSSFGASGAS